jgi:tetratricopeptide (TPR) repeat protein
MEDRFVSFTEVNAPSPLSNTIRDQKLSPTVGERHYIPQDEEVEVKLVEIEKLMRRGSYSAALRSAQSINFEEVNLASTYALIVNEKVARANVALGDRYLAKGDLDRAKNNYQAAIDLANSDEKTKALTGLTKQAITDLSESRSSLIETLREILISQDYERWCEIRKGIQNTSILDHLSSVVRDVSLTEILEPQVPPKWPPIADPRRGWTDPAPIDELTVDNGVGTVLLDRPSVTPGFSFSATSARQLSLEAISDLASETVRDEIPVARVNELRASSSFPLMAAVLTAQGRLYAIENKLNFIGISAGSTPLYRYSYLAEQAKKKLDFVAEIDSKMLPMQIELDDFIAVVGPLKSYINEHSAEFQALNTKIAELQTTLTSLNVSDGKIGQTVQALTQAEDDCDVEWWEVLVSVLVVIAATAVGTVIGLLVGGVVGAIAGGVSSLATSIVLTIEVWSNRAITCDNVSQAREDFQKAQSALKAGINNVQAELNQALINRDIVITELASLNAAYDDAVKSNQVRVLNAGTLSRILGVLDSVRRNVILRTHTLARMAQDAFNTENDEQVNVIASSHTHYLDEDSRGYTASSVLKRDLDGLEHIRLTGRTCKKMQLSQTVSLRKHYPSSFGAILTTGIGQFATRLSDFDRWFPGTYMQTLKEVQVEVFIEDKPQSIRGYLTNNGASYVRFADHGNYVEIDNNDVIAETDQDLRKLCYKRRRRHHPVETMAFPSFDSTLYNARATEIQEQERNFFEGCGLESTWKIELMPDQILEYARITDVKVHFQFEALFDTALKSVVESKRYVDRNETAIVSIRQLLQDQGRSVDFTQPIEAVVNSFMFEAPYLGKDIRDVALMIRPKQLPLLNGVAKLRLDYQQQSPIDVETNEQGIVATANVKPTGINTSSLANLTQGKDVAGKWLIEILELPQGFQFEDIDDLLLMLRYTFKQA